MWGQIEAILLDMGGTLSSTVRKSEAEKRGVIRYQEATSTRIVSPETREVILKLFRRGYRLGLVGNTSSSAGVAAALQ